MPSDIVIGVAYEQAPRAHTGILTLANFDRNREDQNDFFSNIFGSKASLPWSTEDGRVIMWLELRYIDEDEPVQKKTKKTTKRSTVRSRPAKQAVQAVKEEPIRECISLAAFPPSRTADSLSPDVSDQEGLHDKRSDHEESYQEEPDHEGPDPEGPDPEGQDHEGQEKLLESDKSIEAGEDQEEQQDHQPLKKRPRGPTLDSDDDPLVRHESRYGRRSKASAKIRASHS